MLDLNALAARNAEFRAKTGHMVTVAALRAALADLPDEALVVLQKDAEGNGYSPLAVEDDYTPSIYAAWYVPETTWHGEVYDLGPDADGETFEPGPGDLLAVVFAPVN